MTNQTEIRTARKKHPVIKAVKATKLVSFILLAVALIPIVLLPFLFACVIINPFDILENCITIDPLKTIVYEIEAFVYPVIWWSTVAIIGYTIIFALLTPLFQIFLGFLSGIHVIILCVFNNKIKRLPIAIIFRTLTVIFGIGGIVCTVLVFTGAIPIYDYLRTVIFFFGGSIVLNIAVE